MEIKYWVSFSAICVLLHCCHTCEGRPKKNKPANCSKGFFNKSKMCSSNFSIAKRLLEDIMKRNDAGETEPYRAFDETAMNTGAEPDARATGEEWVMPGEEVDEQPEARDEEEEMLRKKELELLFVRAILDDLENGDFDDM